MMKEFLNKCGGYGIIDGGFATELERHGVDLNDPLWSAKCLFTSPHLVRRVQLLFFNYLFLFQCTFIHINQEISKTQSRNFIMNQESLYTWERNR